MLKIVFNNIVQVKIIISIYNSNIYVLTSYYNIHITKVTTYLNYNGNEKHYNLLVACIYSFIRILLIIIYYNKICYVRFVA